jgi:type III secretion system FlhB-like substrate exporter
LRGDRSDDVDDWADESDVDFDENAAPPSYFEVVADETARQTAESDSVSGSARALTPDDDTTAPIVLAVSVTNAAETVTATATIGGWLQRIELAPHVTSIDEAELAREIIATAELARLKGQASQRTLVESMLTLQGSDSHTARDYVDEYMNLPTAAQAAEAEAEATARYLRGEYGN